MSPSTLHLKEHPAVFTHKMGSKRGWSKVGTMFNEDACTDQKQKLIIKIFCLLIREQTHSLKHDSVRKAG